MLPEVITFVAGAILAAFYISYLITMVSKNREAKSTTDLRQERENRYTPYISLIIPTYNEEEKIVQKLDNTLALDYPKDNMEIVVIDSGSTDTTPLLIKNFIEENHGLNVLFIEEKNRKGKSNAVNTAYAKSTGSIKIISDVDSLLRKDTISELVSDLDKKDVGAAMGRQVLVNLEESEAAKSEKLYKDWYNILRQGESRMDSTPIFDGHLAAYKSDLIEKVPENINADDAALAIMIRRKGYRTIYESEAVFYEAVASTFKAKFNQKVRRGQGLMRILWKNKDMLFNSKYGSFGKVIMPAEFFIHLVSPILTMVLVSSFVISLIESPYALYFGLAILLLAFASFFLRKNRILYPIRLIAAFLELQTFLFIALIFWITGRKMNVWKKVEKEKPILKDLKSAET